MDKNHFRLWLVRALEDLKHDDPDEAHFAHCADVVREAGERAVRLGLVEVYERCRARELLGIRTARSVLSFALSQVPEGKPAYYDATAAAEYLGITTKQLYKAVEKGRLTPLRGPRRSYRFTKALLDHYVLNS